MINIYKRMHETQKLVSVLSAEKHIHSASNQQSYPGLQTTWNSADSQIWKINKFITLCPTHEDDNKAKQWST